MFFLLTHMSEFMSISTELLPATGKVEPSSLFA
jgi:hypothetical protein